MQKRVTFLISFVILAISSLLPSTSVYAQYGQYGSPPPQGTIMIQKLVSEPFTSLPSNLSTLTYVNNLSPADPRFAPGQDVVFKIMVQNTSSIVLTNVTVKDILPTNITPVAGPGTFDQSSNTITFTVDNLNPGDQRTFFLTTQIAPVAQLPSDKSLFCLINTSQVFSNASNGTNSPSDQSTSQFCIEKQVLGVTTAPSAGPEFGMLLVGGELAALGLGLFIRRK